MDTKTIQTSSMANTVLIRLLHERHESFAKLKRLIPEIEADGLSSMSTDSTETDSTVALFELNQTTATPEVTVFNGTIYITESAPDSIIQGDTIRPNLPGSSEYPDDVRSTEPVGQEMVRNITTEQDAEPFVGDPTEILTNRNTTLATNQITSTTDATDQTTLGPIGTVVTDSPTESELGSIERKESEAFDLITTEETLITDGPQTPFEEQTEVIEVSEVDYATTDADMKTGASKDITIRPNVSGASEYPDDVHSTEATTLGPVSQVRNITTEQDAEPFVGDPTEILTNRNTTLATNQITSTTDARNRTTLGPIDTVVTHSPTESQLGSIERKESEAIDLFTTEETLITDGSQTPFEEQTEVVEVGVSKDDAMDKEMASSAGYRTKENRIISPIVAVIIGNL